MIKILRMKRIFKYLFLLCVLFASNCKEPYEPPILTYGDSYLVVEGLINLNDVSTIKLSRTTPLKDTTKLFPEKNAELFIEDDLSKIYPFIEQGAGIYAMKEIGLSADKKYRLRINAEQKTYLSDFLEAKITPAIDSVNFKIQNTGVQFYANTHDSRNKTIFYRWEYDETWEYRAVHQSKIEYINGKFEYRDPLNSLWRCWKTGQSKNIIIGTSSTLTDDLILDNPIVFISAMSGKANHGYSFLLKQYALTKEAYVYWQTLKKNTEGIGTTFDPQPSIPRGNIHCVTNPEEPVIGYISASSVTTKRFYFDNRNLPFANPTYLAVNNLSAEHCEVSSIFLSPQNTFEARAEGLFKFGSNIPLDPIFGRGGVGLISYSYAAPDCVDCRLKGGTTVRPSFWPLP